MRNKGYDGGKKIGGIKRHLLVDLNGLPIDIHLTPAHESERDVLFHMLQRNTNKRQVNSTQSCIDTVYADGGYTGERFHINVYLETGVRIEIVKRSDHNRHQFKVLPKRWVVERSFAWLEKCKRLHKNVERLLSTSKVFVQLCFIRLLVRRLVRIGMG